jgi:superfamily II DNA/RNA helicase
MDTNEPHPEEPPIFLFSTPEGHALCRKILEAHLTYEPHDIQIEGICKVLDNVDLLVILATGMGKTGFLSMYMLVVLAIKKDPSLCPTAKFPDNPCMLVICPTKYLEHQMVSDYSLTQTTRIMGNSR